MTYLRPTAWLLSSLLALASVACSTKDTPAPEQDQLTKVSYAQTQCADKWGQVRTTQQLETVAAAYLAQQGITLSNPKATAPSAPGLVCHACTCPTGTVLVGEVPASQLAAIQALGFTKL